MSDVLMRLLYLAIFVIFQVSIGLGVGAGALRLISMSAVDFPRQWGALMAGLFLVATVLSLFALSAWGLWSLLIKREKWW